jgi:hypothetical protein
MALRWLLTGLVLLTAGCMAWTPLPQPPPPGTTINDIRGSWRGTWGGGPVSLLITDQQPSAGYSGLYVGSYQALGHERPGVSGVLTSWINRAEVSAIARGWFGGVQGQLTLYVYADSPDGQQRFTARLDGPDRLVGMGDSTFRWGPTGPIQLTRAAKPIS